MDISYIYNMLIPLYIIIQSFPHLFAISKNKKYLNNRKCLFFALSISIAIELIRYLLEKIIYTLIYYAVYESVMNK